MTDQVSTANPRSRSTSASMQRTRDAALSGARRVLAELGVRKASMVDIAVRAGMAKATLYNHFRTKDEVVAALVLHEAGALLEDARTVAAEPAKALARIAWRLSTHQVIRGALAAEPSLAADAVTAHTDAHEVWTAVHDMAASFLASDLGLAVDAHSTDLVLRWWTSVALMPLRDGEDPARVLSQATVLLAAISSPAGTSGTSTTDVPAVPVQSSPV